MAYLRDVTQAKTIFGTLLLNDPGSRPLGRRIAGRGNDNDRDDPPPIGAISRPPLPRLSGGAAEEPLLSLELEVAA
jgi:hypothetical protein